MNEARSSFLDSIDQELEQAAAPVRGGGPKRSRRVLGPLAAGVLLAGGLVVSAPAAPATAAAACNEPDFVARDHNKMCGISLQRFTYKRMTWTAGTQCYVFDHNTMVCGPLNWQFAGQKTACQRHY